ncbi:MAG: hypothetical protein ACAI35_27090 [Candidatus Methylacidiphilales bacterium]
MNTTDSRVDQHGIHLLAKPLDVAYKSRDDQLRDPACVLDALIRGNGQPYAGSGTAAGSHHVRTEKGTDASLPWKYGRPIASHSRLLAWSAAADRAIDPAVFAKKERVAAGGEHIVFDIGNDRLLKLTKPGFYGAQAEDAGAYLQRMAMTNRVFGDNVMFEGYVTLPGEPEARAAISQPFVEGEAATMDQIRDFLHSKGFDDIGNFWVQPATGVAVWDVSTPGNAIVRKSNGRVIPVDFTLQPATTRQMAEVRAIRGLGLER